MTRTVMITGTSTGFGRATAHRFVRAGWNVVATMRSPEREAELGAQPNVLVTRLDVQDPASIAAAVDAGQQRFGGLDVLVNNAGFGLFGLFEANSPAKVREQFDVNVFGLMDVTRAVLPHFRGRRRGAIVNITSGAGVFGLPMVSLYTASKFAVEGFSESLAWELASQNIRVKLVEPGGVLETNFGRRSGEEATHAVDLPDYAAFLAHAGAVFEGLRSDRRLATAADVAEVIFTAATDESDRLRYVATPDIVPLVSARRETSEEAYMALMRERFGLRAGASAKAG
ncbi:SDR family oxidoreductase [Nannocystis punicea]|uniref:SDR family oxidoreductase n=1 Tax=Nannocystis punicea TaxID=2995304 RepID=A0ABY7H129_9BACT|nr:SDR family oxidoreductase [Nannocystis poenicansa]WAS92956.1 SDR family oxidoreductase [Nannocystis poenicansa]